MGKKKKHISRKTNPQFFDASLLNNETLNDYYNRLRIIALARFKWNNLPKTMNELYLEKVLFENGQASFLKDEKYGFINTKCADNGYVNIYGLPSLLNCYSFDFNTSRELYVGNTNSNEYEECILIQNNYDRIPTSTTLLLFASRLANCERVIDVNINSQKSPTIILCDDTTRFTMENLYKNVDNNEQVIFVNKSLLDDNQIQSLNTQSRFVAKDIQEIKKDIWNEALTYLGINNNNINKKERVIQSEINSNNEIINIYLDNFLEPRKIACKQFNEKYGENISVEVNKNLQNIVKEMEVK